MKLISTTLIIFAIFFASACKTTDPMVKVNKKKDKITLFSSNKDESALARSTDHSSINKAIAILKDKYKKEPNNVPVILDLSRMFLLKKNLKLANKLCRKALSLDVHNKRGAKLLAELELTAGQLEKAEIILFRLGGLKSKDAEVANLLGLIQLKRRKTDEAFTFFKAGLKYDPDNAAILMNVGTMHLKYRQLDQAEQHFNRVLKSLPNHLDALTHLAVIRANEGKTSSATKLYNRVIDIDSHNAFAHFNLSILQHRSGQLKEALGSVKTALNERAFSPQQSRLAIEHRKKIEYDIKKREEEERERKTNSKKSLAAKKLRSKTKGKK